MTLKRCSDLSAADWITACDCPWQQLAEFGPPAFPAYARLRFLPDPVYNGQSENDVDSDEHGPSEPAQLRAVLAVLGRHTGTPGDCYFCLWDGWGPPLHDHDGRLKPDASKQATGAVPAIDPGMISTGWAEFPSPARHEPMVVIPNRAFYLFRGAVAELGDRGPAQGRPGQPGTGFIAPAFVWPADHAWCIANDVDPHWAGIGADTAAINQLIADPQLNVVSADPRAYQPRYR